MSNQLEDVELGDLELKHQDTQIEIADLELKHQGIPQIEIDHDVEICCSHSSLYGLKYLSRIGVSASILIFSFVQIARFPDVDNSIYFSLISSIMGYYISSIPKAFNGST